MAKASKKPIKFGTQISEGIAGGVSTAKQNTTAGKVVTTGGTAAQNAAQQAKFAGDATQQSTGSDIGIIDTSQGAMAFGTAKTDADKKLAFNNALQLQDANRTNQSLPNVLTNEQKLNTAVIDGKEYKIGFGNILEGADLKTQAKYQINPGKYTPGVSQMSPAADVLTLGKGWAKTTVVVKDMLKAGTKTQLKNSPVIANQKTFNLIGNLASKTSGGEGLGKFLLKLGIGSAVTSTLGTLAISLWAEGEAAEGWNYIESDVRKLKNKELYNEWIDLSTKFKGDVTAGDFIPVYGAVKNYVKKIDSINEQNEFRKKLFAIDVDAETKGITPAQEFENQRNEWAKAKDEQRAKDLQLTQQQSDIWAKAQADKLAAQTQAEKDRADEAERQALIWLQYYKDKAALEDAQRAKENADWLAMQQMYIDMKKKQFEEESTFSNLKFGLL